MSVELEFWLAIVLLEQVSVSNEGYLKEKTKTSASSKAMANSECGLTQ